MDPRPPVATLAGSTIINRQAGEVVEVVLAGPLDDHGWPMLQQHLLSLIQVRQPTELWLDPQDTGKLLRFSAGLGTVADALAQFGGTLVAAGVAVAPTTRP